MLFKSKNYIVYVSIEFCSSLTRSIVCFFDTGASPSLIRAEALVQGWLDKTHQSDMPEIRGESDTKLVVSRTIALHLSMCRLRTSVILA